MGLVFRLDKKGLNLSFHTHKRDARFIGREMRPGTCPYAAFFRPDSII